MYRPSKWVLFDESGCLLYLVWYTQQPFLSGFPPLIADSTGAASFSWYKQNPSLIVFRTWQIPIHHCLVFNAPHSFAVHSDTNTYIEGVSFAAQQIPNRPTDESVYGSTFC
jgi:hypothetical protein